MQRIEGEIVICRSAEDIFDYVADGRNEPPSVSPSGVAVSSRR